MKRIYLDNNASTPIDMRVFDVVVEELRNYPGNPSSPHSFGQETLRHITKARQTIANFLKVNAKEILFTSGATESVNLVIRGTFEDSLEGHMITSTAEHSCVYKTALHMQKKGVDVTFLDTGLYGAVKPEQLRAAIKPNTRLIALTAVNNETGVKTDVEAIAQIAKEHNIPLLIDAVALIGKELFVIPEGVTALCFSGHKIHAPKGIGIVFIRRKMKFTPMQTGGEAHEYGLRAGTENVPGIIGMAKAVEILGEELPAATFRMEKLRNKLEAALLENLPNTYINGEGPRICNTSNIGFEGVQGETLLAQLDMAGVAVTHGSACSSGALEPSRILLSMGIPKDRVVSSIRISLSRMTTEEDIDRAIEIITSTVNKLRSPRS